MQSNRDNHINDFKENVIDMISYQDWTMEVLSFQEEYPDEFEKVDKYLNQDKGNRKLTDIQKKRVVIFYKIYYLYVINNNPLLSKNDFLSILENDTLIQSKSSTKLVKVFKEILENTLNPQ